jgi:glycine cleavage system H protein
MAQEYPEGLQYLDSHEYVKLEDGIATIGITAHAIEQLGDIVFLELPEKGDKVAKGESFGNVESVKAVAELYAPLSGKVTEINQTMVDAPDTLVDDPYGDGWLIQVRYEGELENTLDAAAYQALVEGSE